MLDDIANPKLRKLILDLLGVFEKLSVPAEKMNTKLRMAWILRGAKPTDISAFVSEFNEHLPNLKSAAANLFSEMKETDPQALYVLIGKLEAFFGLLSKKESSFWLSKSEVANDMKQFEQLLVEFMMATQEILLDVNLTERLNAD